MPVIDSTIKCADCSTDAKTGKTQKESGLTEAVWIKRNGMLDQVALNCIEVSESS
jgi:hypothetical protein